MALRSQMKEFALVLTSPPKYFCLYASLSVCLLLFSLCGNLYICLCVYCTLCRSLYNISKYVPSAYILKISSAFQLPVTHFFPDFQSYSSHYCVCKMHEPQVLHIGLKLGSFWMQLISMSYMSRSSNTFQACLYTNAHCYNVLTTIFFALDMSSIKKWKILGYNLVAY